MIFKKLFIFSEIKLFLKITLLLSSKVKSNLVSLNVDLNIFENVIVKDIFGCKSLLINYRKYCKKMTLMFTVFGPIYILKKNFIHI